MIDFQIQLFVNPKLQKHFPNDPYSDLLLYFNEKKFKVQKAHLRIESQYFCQMFNENQQQEMKLIMEPQQLKELSQENNLNIYSNLNIIESDKIDLIDEVFQVILMTFYGYQLNVNVSNISFVFQLCLLFQIDTLIAQIEEFIADNLDKFNFWNLLALSIQYKSKLREVLLNYLLKLDFQFLKLDFQISNFPLRIFSQHELESLITFYYDSNSTNVSQMEIYRIIQLFCDPQISHQRFEMQEDMIKRLIKTELLTSQENYIIFGVNPEQTIIGDSVFEVSKNLNEKQFTFGQQFKLLTSENVYQKKIVEEVKFENQKLKQEIFMIKKQIDQNNQLIQQILDKNFKSHVEEQISQLQVFINIHLKYISVYK